MRHIFQDEKGLLFKIAGQRKNQICFLVFGLLSITVMIIIFIFSNQAAENSAAFSGNVRDWLDGLLKQFEWLFGSGFLNWISVYLRKLAHFVLYTALGAFLSAAFLNTRLKNTPSKLSFAVLIGLCYSITDEIHQLFIDGRSCELRDVLIDLGGVIAGALITLLIYKIYKKQQKSVNIRKF